MRKYRQYLLGLVHLLFIQDDAFFSIIFDGELSCTLWEISVNGRKIVLLTVHVKYYFTPKIARYCYYFRAKNLSSKSLRKDNVDRRINWVNLCSVKDKEVVWGGVIL